ncbi:MAG: hypothetical protein QNJ73_07760 [Gammaproteobacteria bacterium]|nr:hypothetical protein [Gammaproteobacteria bacterium]
MTTLQERIAGERRRLRTVRQKLSAAVEQGAAGNADWVPFYAAVANYMEAAMDRLHAQDVKMGDMIREKLGQIDDSAKQALNELDERLAGNEKRLKRMLAAGRSLVDQGIEALDEFEDAARDFTDFIVRNMGHHGGTTNLAAKLFTPEDWEYMADQTDEAIANEMALFETVEASTPANLEVPAEQ